jgi:hypothetical protein
VRGARSAPRRHYEGSLVPPQSHAERQVAVSVEAVIQKPLIGLTVIGRCKALPEVNHFSVIRVREVCPRGEANRPF